MALKQSQLRAMMQAQVLDADDLAFDLGAAFTMPEFSVTLGQAGELPPPKPSSNGRNIAFMLGGILVIGIFWKAVSE